MIIKVLVIITTIVLVNSMINFALSVVKVVVVHTVRIVVVIIVK